MRKRQLTIVAILAMSVLTLASDRVTPAGLAEMFPSAQVLPKGAIVYVQSRNLGTQLRAWYNSGAHKRYYQSASFQAFTNSRLALKFRERLDEFEQAVGAPLDETGFLNAVGGQSAIALYDIGALQFVFITELPASRAASASLLQLASQLESRKHGNTVYYIKVLKSELGEEDRTFAFALQGNRALMATSEDLMKRTLQNITDRKSSDRLVETIVATATNAKGFVAHDITLWLDQVALNQNRYFKAYWIHDNVSQLATISQGLIDLEIGAESFRERRWFILTEAARDRQTNLAGDLSGVLRFAPIDAQVVKVHSVGKDRAQLYEAMQLLLFGRERAATLPSRVYNNAYTREYSSYEDSSARQYQRYTWLDERFDLDIDSEDLTFAEAATKSSRPLLATALDGILAETEPLRYALITDPVVDTETSFVNFNRALVIELAKPGKFVPAKLEAVIAEQLKQRFVVTGGVVKFEWQGEAGGPRSLAQTLIEHGGTYLLVDKFLIIANARDYLTKLVQQTSATATTEYTKTNLESYAVVRLQGTKTPFDKLMRRLDGSTSVRTTPTQSVDEEGEEAAEERKINFFSENISSLLGVVGNVSTVTFEQSSDQGVINEQLNYLFSPASAPKDRSSTAQPQTR
ncbi:MAG: hypothetical protein AB1489_14920 [Acidobacteriota bacterium]